MGKFFRMFCVLAACFSISVSAQDLRPQNPEPMSGKTAMRFFADNNITSGWNLGNTLDAIDDNVNPVVVREGAWGAPLATQTLFNGVAELKFDIVRIPVSWVGKIGPAPSYTIDAAWMQRVVEVVDYGKKAGIKAMIINIHHDGNTSDGRNPRTWGFLDLQAAVNSSARKTEIQNQLAVVWTQIANHFKNYGDYLIFETLNEVHTGNWGSIPGAGGMAAYQNEQDILFDWNQAAVTAIRATGGNNAARFIAVPALGSTEPEYVINAHNRQKLLPSDPGNGTDKLIAAVHYYHPWRYTVADATGQTGSNLIHTWGTTAERAHPGSAMRSLKTTFLDNGIAAYVGEWGAPTDQRAGVSVGGVTMTEAIRNTHIEYIAAVAEAARTNGIIPMYWDDGGYFRMLSRSNGRPPAGFHTRVYEAMINAVKPPVTGQWSWNSYNDGVNGGTSTINLTVLSGTQTASGNITGAYEHGYAGWEAVPQDPATFSALRTATAISFKVVGDGKTYKAALPTTDITDHCYYTTTFSTQSGVETTVTLKISDFVQGDWGVQKPFNPLLIDRIQWQTNDGAMGPFNLTVSDFVLLNESTSISSTRTVSSVKKPALIQRGNVITSTAPIRLYTVNGKLAAESSVKGPESLVTLNLSRVPNGLYIAKSGTASLKVRLQK